jgi:enterochelin esterase-like enzyme
MFKIKLLTIMLGMSLLMSAQESKVYDNLSMTSRILKCEKKYAIYLPPDYETSQRSYPVLYLLHGGANNQTTWVQHGEVKSIADKAIMEGLATPMIIVMPDASGEHRGYSNDALGNWRYEDFFFEEFMPYIEKTYRVRPGKRYRAIAGLSMGGNGTFIYALHHPELFSAACPLSAATGPLTVGEAKERLAMMKQQGLTDAQVENWYHRYNIIEMINNIPEEKKSAVRWYIDCGDDDPNDMVWEGNCLIHMAMRKKGIPHEFRIRDGAHTWEYWRSALPVVLEFVTASFHG